MNILKGLKALLRLGLGPSRRDAPSFGERYAPTLQDAHVSISPERELSEEIARASSRPPQAAREAAPTSPPPFAPPPEPVLARVGEPDVEGVARVVPLDPIIAARYWRLALQNISFQDLAKAPIKDAFPASEIAGMGFTAGLDDTKPDEIEDILVVAALCTLDRRGQPDFKARRHVLWAVPARRVKKSGLAPRFDAIPVFNSSYLAPTAAKGCFEIAVGPELDGALREVMGRFEEDEPTWSVWWRAPFEALAAFVGAESDEAVVLSLMAAAGSTEQTPKGGQGRRYGLFGLVMAPTASSGVDHLIRAYRFVEDHGADHAQELQLFQRLVGPAVARDIGGRKPDERRAVVAHIDGDDRGKRGLYPLDRTQRTAVEAALGLAVGEMQGVNGPPGSGKTAMLKAVVASLWVRAALDQAECPIVIACGATNQSVTNVIGGFGEALGGPESPLHTQRWLAHAASYGAFLPSKTILSEADKRKEYAAFVCIRRTKGPFPYEYVDRPDPLKPTAALDAEAGYVAAAATALSQPGIDVLEVAIAKVWHQLKTILETEPMAMAWQIYEEQSPYWTAARKELVTGHLDRFFNRQPRAPDDLEELLDITVRAEAFHWAARYWEGRFLLSQRERVLTMHPRNVEEALRRVAMLTPCLVSTLHTGPQFAEIGSDGAIQGDVRDYVCGLFDLLVIDEGGQAPPELGAALFTLAKRALVVGDMKQLSPIWTNTPLGEMAIAVNAGATDELDAIARSRRSVSSGSVLGMVRSVSKWRERADDGVTLRYHYRCKPSIIQYCNELSYEGTLKPRTDENAPFPIAPMGWVAVDAEPHQARGSWRNEAEADEIVEWLAEQWPALSAAFPGKPVKEIFAIITPYRPQADWLAERLVTVFREASERGGATWPTKEELEDVTVGTVHRLQGAEKPLVCFSLVEGPAQAAGSFIDRDATMLNVAVSRAKSSFVLFGNPKRLMPPTDAPDLPPSFRLGAYLRRAAKRPLYPTAAVIIESPTKRPAIQKILGKSVVVLATNGALQKLPLDGGVDVARGFLPRPQRSAAAERAINDAAARIAEVDEVILATDDDRMGEYIAWQFTRALGDQLAGKIVRRARLGAITPTHVRGAIAAAGELDRRRVLVEMARDVVDALISARFGARLSASDNASRPQPQNETGELLRLRQIGACSEGPSGRATSGGRVQAAVLRLLLDEARAVIAADERREIEAVVTIEGSEVRGLVYRLADGRATTPTSTAARFIQRQRDRGFRLKLSGLPERLVEALEPPRPGTVEILAHAWRSKSVPLGRGMAAMQALFDGSWTNEGSSSDPTDPVDISSDAGHPPITPLDRAAPPSRFRGLMNAETLAVYQAVWDFHRLGGDENAPSDAIQVETMIVEAVLVPGDGSTPELGVRFIGLACSGVPEDLVQIALDGPARNPALAACWHGLNGARPQLTAVPVSTWDMTPASLLEAMRDCRIGRPSTYVSVLEALVEKKLIEFPQEHGVVRLTPTGVLTAMFLEDCEPELSGVGFSERMAAALESIEAGDREAGTVLDELLAGFGGDGMDGPRPEAIWADLSTLVAAMDAPHAALSGALVSAASQGNG